MKKYSQRGFTLIELLVVIAIIGILSSVVLASLSTARTKGADVAVKSNLANMRAAAEIIGGDTQDYSTICTAGTNTKNQYDAAVAQGVTTASNVCAAGSGTDKDKWAATVNMKGGNWACVDYKGNATTTTAAQVSASDWACI